MAIFRLLSFDVLIHFKNLFWGFSQENCRRRDKNVWIRLKFSFVRVCWGCKYDRYAILNSSSYLLIIWHAQLQCVGNNNRQSRFLMRAKRYHYLRCFNFTYDQFWSEQAILLQSIYYIRVLSIQVLFCRHYLNLMNEEQRWVLNYTLRPIDCCLISVSINIFTPKNKLLAMRIFWSFLLCFGWLLYSRSLLELWFFFFLQKLICLFTKTALIKMILNIFIFLAFHFSMLLQIIAIVVCF